MPLISVIVPMFRTEEFIDKCLDSLAKQTFADFEVICVDDCSPDGSAERAERYRNMLPALKILKHKSNIGLGGARNTGIRAASGEYIASVDSDDWVGPTFLENLAKPVLEQSSAKIDVVIAGFQRVNSLGEAFQTYKPTKKDFGDEGDYLDNRGNEIDIFNLANPAFWNKLWRKDIFFEHDIWFPEHVFYQDLATTPRFLAKSEKIVRVPFVDYNYLVREDSATTTGSDKHILDYLRVFRILCLFLARNNLSARYHTEFIEAINRGYRFHSGNIDHSELSEAEKEIYLDLLLITKMGLIESSPILSNLTSEQRLEALSTATSTGVIGGMRKKLDLTIAVKTFCRPEMIRRFVNSVCDYQDRRFVSFSEILICDDSGKDMQDETLEFLNSVKDRLGDTQVNYIQETYNIGLSRGRNILMAKAQSEDVLLCDDDFILDPDSDFEKVISDFNESDKDILGGWLKNDFDLESGGYTFWGSRGSIVETSTDLVVFLDERSIEKAKSEIIDTDFILNYFIAKRRIFDSLKWDEELKNEEHYNFFVNAKRQGIRVGFTNKLFAKHTNEKKRNSQEYNAHRFGASSWERYLYGSLEKIGKERRIVYRWRDGAHITWTADAVRREQWQQKWEIHQPILAQHVAPQLISLAADNCFFGYFDQRHSDDDGQLHLFHRSPIVREHPQVHDKVEIWVRSLQSDEPARKLVETSAWNFQQGSFAQFLPGSNSRIIFNDQKEDLTGFEAVIWDLNDGEVRRLPKPVAAISADGTQGLSINFSRLMAYRPGYGYAGVSDPFADIATPEDDGLFLIDLPTGSNKLIVSCADLYRSFFADAVAGEPQKIVINHASFSPDGRFAVLLVRLFSETPPFPTLTILVDLNTGIARQIYKFISHYNWLDNKTLLATSIDTFERDRNKKIELMELDVTTGSASLVDPAFFKGDGHCTYSPDKRFILFDSYSSDSFPYRKLQVYDLEKRTGVTLGYFFSDPAFTGNDPDLRCDLHPRWAPNGQWITFDSTHEGFRGVYKIEMRDVHAIFEANQLEPDEASLRDSFAQMLESRQKKVKQKKSSSKQRSQAAIAVKSLGRALRLRELKHAIRAARRSRQHK